MTIIKVRRTLSEIEIERYGIVGLEMTQSQTAPSDLAPWMTSIIIPAPMLVVLAQSVTTGLRGTGIRTQRTKEHEAGEGHDPGVHGVEHAATAELEEEQVLDTQPRESSIKQWTNQKAIG